MSARMPYRVRYIPRLALSLGVLDEVSYHTSSPEDALAFCGRVQAELGGSHNGIISRLDTFDGYQFKPAFLNAG